MVKEHDKARRNLPTEREIQKLLDAMGETEHPFKSKRLLLALVHPGLTSEEKDSGKR